MDITAEKLRTIADDLDIPDSLVTRADVARVLRKVADQIGATRTLAGGVDAATAGLVGELLDELARARAKFPGDNVTFMALVEEVGELSTAMFERSREDVRREAVQVAVMAMRIILDPDRECGRMRARIISPEPPANAEHRADELSRFVHGIFMAEHPAVIGATLVSLVAMHLAGHRIEPDAREALLETHIRAVREMIPIFDRQAAAFERKGKPS